MSVHRAGSKVAGSRQNTNRLHNLRIVGQDQDTFGGNSAICSGSKIEAQLLSDKCTVAIQLSRGGSYPRLRESESFEGVKE
jgi:hypothetical protein